ncbi:type II secretion system protein GspM [Bradyrhizobium symbiodeficiens]|uniref:type II secretion system protein GspM n=1 Tax=Bradyrhizobium symbiodeficiens TaxID=1404367 RepID=UPI0030CE87BD
MSRGGLLGRRLIFFGLNAAIVLAFCAAILEPIASHFAERNDDMMDSAAQLAQIRRVADEAAGLGKPITSGVDPYLSGVEERIASADLQANLQALAGAKGLAVQAVRGLPGRQGGHWRAVSVGLEAEGGAIAVRDLVAAIETQTPFLFITDLSLRTLSDGDDSRMRLSLTVEGALRSPTAPPAGPLLSENRSGGDVKAANR